MKQISLYIALFLMVLTSACSLIERTIELPLPEIFLTSTLTEANETQIKIKGEIAGAREFANDIFGVVYSEKSNPTIDDNKLNISANNGVFDVTATNLKVKTEYYFRGYFKTITNKVYYSNQLVSSKLFDNRWERQGDIPDNFRFFTGNLFFHIQRDLALFNTEDETKGTIPFYTFNYDYLNGDFNKKVWFDDKYIEIRISTGIKEMFVINPSPDRVFIGGGFSINNNLPSTKIYNKRMWFIYAPRGLPSIQEIDPSIPIDGETIGLVVGEQMYVVEAKSQGEIYDFTNLEFKKKKNHIIQNLGRVVSTGTSQKGYVMSESKLPTIKGCILYEYNPLNDSWTTRKPFAGEDRNDGVLFSVKNKIYYGLGRSKKTKQALKDIWEYDPTTDNWKQVGFYPGNGNIALIQTTFNDIVYIGMGYQTTVNPINGSEFSGVRDFWIFKP
jgi:hypothetical protein